MSNDHETRTRCKAPARSGAPCKNYAMVGSEYCRLHQPVDSGSRIKRRSFKVVEPELDNPGLRRQLAAELDRLTGRIADITSGYPPDTPVATRQAKVRSPVFYQPAFAEDLDGNGVGPAKDAGQWLEPEEKPAGFSLFDVALVGLGAFVVLRWLFRRKNDK